MKASYRARGQLLAESAARVEIALERGALLEADAEKDQLIELIHALLDLLEEGDVAVSPPQLTILH